MMGRGSSTLVVAWLLLAAAVSAKMKQKDFSDIKGYGNAHAYEAYKESIAANTDADQMDDVALRQRLTADEALFKQATDRIAELRRQINNPGSLTVQQLKELHVKLETGSRELDGLIEYFAKANRALDRQMVAPPGMRFVYNYETQKIDVEPDVDLAHEKLGKDKSRFKQMKDAEKAQRMAAAGTTRPAPNPPRYSNNRA